MKEISFSVAAIMDATNYLPLNRGVSACHADLPPMVFERKRRKHLYLAFLPLSNIELLS